MPSFTRDGSPSPRPASTPTHRIAKLLARAGVASRREIERMIAEGRVALNGTTLDTPATLLSSLDGVTVDGNLVAAPEAARLFLFHKPTGLLTAERDPLDRRTIYDVLPEGLPRLMPVGRLDLNTEGLLLMTTDGGLKRQLELPATGVERAYRARAYGQVSQAQLEDLIHGIEIEGVRYGSINANIERRTGANLWIEMILKEGKNREVRRVLEHLGLQVSRLIRTRYGPFVLGDLRPGQIGEVRSHDVDSFRADPTRLELPQPSRKQAVMPVTELEMRPPALPAPKAMAERAPARPRAPRVKDEPRRRSDGTVATRTTGTRGDRARTFRHERGEYEAAPAAPRPARPQTTRFAQPGRVRPGDETSENSRRSSGSFHGSRTAATRAPADRSGPRDEGRRTESNRGGERRAEASPHSAQREGGRRGDTRRTGGPRGEGQRAFGQRTGASGGSSQRTGGQRDQPQRDKTQRDDAQRSTAPRGFAPAGFGPRSGGQRNSRPGNSGPRSPGPRGAAPSRSGPRGPGPKRPGGKR